MKKLLVLLLALFLLLGLGYYLVSTFFLQNRKSSKAVLSVNAPFSDAGVFIKDVYLGPTPYFSDSVEPGEVDLRVGDWVGKVTLTAGALTVVNQDLGPSGFTGGEVIWLTENRGETSLTVISSVSGVAVEVDGNKIGEAPVKSSNLSEGEHKLVLKKEGYVERSLAVRLQRDYTVNVNVELLLNPLPAEVKKMVSSTDKITLYDFSTTNDSFLTDQALWLKGMIFFFKSYAFDAPHKPDYYLSADGSLYASNGELLTVDRYPKKNSAPFNLAYFGKYSDKGLSDSAQNTLKLFSSPAESSPAAVVPTANKGKVLETGTGWLRVRKGPGLNNVEIGRLNVGEECEILKEEGEWLEVKLKDGSSGWVSSQFIKKL